MSVLLACALLLSSSMAVQQHNPLDGLRPKSMRYEGVLVVIDANNPAQEVKIERSLAASKDLPERVSSVAGPVIPMRIAVTPSRMRIEFGAFGSQYELDTKKAYYFGAATRNGDGIDEFAIQPGPESFDLIEVFPVPIDRTRQKKIGTDEVHGYKCDVYSVKTREASGKFWRLQSAPDIIVKGAARVGSTIIALHPLVVELGDTIDESVFALPKKGKKEAR